MEATVAPAVLVAPDPAQNGGAAKTSASAIRMKVVNQAQATPVRGKEVGAPLVTWTAPDLNRDRGFVGAAPEADATVVEKAAAPAREAGALAQEEMSRIMTTATPMTRRSKETRGAVAGQPLQ